MPSDVVDTELLALALRVAREAGVLLMDRPATFDISSKSTAIDIATQMDHASEKLIVSALLAARPDDGIIGEEGASRPSRSGITWVIDPVDGTVNYLYGLPGWNISIGAKDEQGRLVGVVHAPTVNSTWTAMRGKGAWFNESPISCNDPISLDRALIGTGFAYDVRARVEQGRIAAALLPQIRDVRRMGSAAVDLCYVAMGAFDGYFEIGLKEWDSAAGALIAQEAGAIVSVTEGDLTICAGPTLHPQLAHAVAPMAR
ncbi:MAG: inositol monophosphatase [Streptomycetaceae bacterium]|nr:MAG: inositol monophosphatase [Streptomycetaceae bacterium]